MGLSPNFFWFPLFSRVNWAILLFLSHLDIDWMRLRHLLKGLDCVWTNNSKNPFCSGFCFFRESFCSCLWCSRLGNSLIGHKSHFAVYSKMGLATKKYVVFVRFRRAESSAGGERNHRDGARVWTPRVSNKRNGQFVFFVSLGRKWTCWWEP